MEGGDRYEWVKELERLAPDHAISNATEVQATTLPFYDPSVQLLRIHDTDWERPEARLYLLRHGDYPALRLNGTSSPIHEMNAGLGGDKPLIHLDEQTCLDYLRCFCFFVRGEDGPFLILEREKHASFASAEHKATVLRHARPSWLLRSEAEPGKDGKEPVRAFHVSSVIWYGHSLFQAHLKIVASGMIDMRDSREERPRHFPSQAQVADAAVDCAAERHGY